MARKLGITRSEMLQLREQGLSNDDIANVLEISRAAVYRYIGKQGGRMENLAAFNEPKKEKVETPTEEQKTPHKAVDSLEKVFEVVKSANGTYRAELDYESKAISVFDSTIGFDQMAELATFIIGLAGRVQSNGEEK